MQDSFVVQARAFGMRTSYEAGQTYDTEDLPYARTDLFLHYADADAAKISYKIVFANDKAPGQFLVDSATGSTLAKPTKTGSYSAQLVAVDGVGATTPVFEWAFLVVPKLRFSVRKGWNATRSLGVSDGYGACVHTDISPL